MSVDILGPLKNMFSSFVDVRRRVSSTYKGAASYGDSAPFRAFVVGRITMVRDINGKDVVSRVHAVIHGYHKLTLQDQYTLPEDFIPRKPKPIAIREATDEGGRHHQTVFF